MLQFGWIGGLLDFMPRQADPKKTEAITTIAKARAARLLRESNGIAAIPPEPLCMVIFRSRDRGEGRMRVPDPRLVGRARARIELGEQRVAAVVGARLRDLALEVGEVAEADRLGGT